MSVKSHKFNSETFLHAKLLNDLRFLFSYKYLLAKVFLAITKVFIQLDFHFLKNFLLKIYGIFRIFSSLLCVASSVTLVWATVGVENNFFEILKIKILFYVEWAQITGIDYLS